ncbi:MAG: hypothetical protein ACJ8F1_03980 [Polyangia bacterium]|jgi:hypothetical protein
MRAPHFPTMLSGLVSAVALFGVASCSTTVASTPSQPAYDTDVRPILMAHCVRCHGAGDALNVPTEPTGPNAPVQANIAGSAAMFKAFNMYFDRYDDATPKVGAHSAAPSIVSTVNGTIKRPDPKAMPPAPAPQLDDWEVDVIKAWSSHPICSTDPNPDPAICPNGPGS